MKIEHVHYVDTDTIDGERNAIELRAKLYETYDDVQIYPNGTSEVRVVATENKATEEFET